MEPRKSMTKITSWVSTENGDVVEGDLRFHPHSDGTYDIESTKQYAGFTLGLDKITKLYTVILKVDDTPIMRRFKMFIALGDILVSINDRLVVDETFEEISTILDMLIKGSFPRKLKFLCPKKCPLQLYLQRMDIESTTCKDLLGFNCSFEYLEYERAFHAAQMHQTSQRDLEWVGYLKSIGGPENLKPAGVFKPSPDLKAIVRRGIPVAYRASVWQKISLSSLHRSTFPPAYYKSLLDKVAAGELDKKVMDEIEKDLDRTFPQHTYFEPSGAGESGLRRVLQAFAVHNPSIGYCQSLNFLTGMMLIFMQEEDVFWLLITVVERLLPEDYYTKNMVGTYVDQYVLAHIIKKCLPKVNAAFEKHSLQLPLITVQWFMCVFVNTLRPEVALRVWDIFLNEGGKVLFRIAAALFQLNEPKLLRAKDASDLFALLRNIGKDVIDADQLIAIAYKGYSPKPLLYKVQLTPTVSPKNRVTMSAPRPVRAVSVGTASEVANPRLKTQTAQGAVPMDLIGIGLAHMGPDNSPESPSPRTSAYEDNFAYLDAVGTIGEPTPTSSRANSAESTTSTGTGTPMKGNFLELLNFGTPNNGPKVRIPSYRSPSKDNKDSGTTDRNSFTGTAARPRSFRQFTPLQVSADQLSYESYIAQNPHKAQGVRKVNRSKVLNFSRADIALWRSSFRPSLEEQYKQMEEARAEWRESSMHRKSLSEQQQKQNIGRSLPSTPVKLAQEVSTETMSTSTPESDED